MPRLRPRRSARRIATQREDFASRKAEPALVRESGEDAVVAEPAESDHISIVDHPPAAGNAITAEPGVEVHPAAVLESRVDLFSSRAHLVGQEINRAPSRAVPVEILLRCTHAEQGCRRCQGSCRAEYG